MPKEPEVPFNLFAAVTESAKDKTKDIPEIPKTVTDFLGKLSLLQGVPAYNLVPNERYLPLKKINNKEIGAFKFFWIDPEWIECLLNGALSLADEQYRLVLANAMNGKYAAEVFYKEAVNKVKNQIKGLDPKIFEEQLKERLLKNNNITYGNTEPTSAQSNWNYTGFFIRSSIISSWTGVEIIAYGYNSTTRQDYKLRVIRLERMAIDIIYCLCEGVITKVEIIQPPETIHFEILPKDKMYRNSSERTLDIIQIAKLSINDKIADMPDSLTLAEMLLSAPFKTSLTIKAVK